MISTSDALEIMAVVAACHRRTAPRMDDREAAIATATVWAELFNEHRLAKPDLIAAVKKRAQICPDAPEPADIIRVARAARDDQLARGIRPVIESRAEHHHGDTKAAKDFGEYPADWDAEQRLGAYWYAMNLHAVPQTTAGWEAIAEQMAEARERRVDA